MIHKDDLNLIQETIETSHRQLKNIFKYSYRVKTKNGNYNWVEDIVFAKYDSQGDHSISYIYKRDINDQKQNEDKIQKLLEEKEIILKEVHHRIKNNMSTIIALLSLQADTLQIPLATTAFEETSKRIRSMMILYDKLYRSSNYKVLSIKEYLLTLIDDIVNTFPNREQVVIEKSIDDFPISTEKLVPLGIILNELLTNTMKYAFAGRREGRITIQAYKKNELAVCIIQDNGNGLPESIDFKNSKGFGLSLVEMLNKQLNGNLKVERLNGTKIILEFK
jgi:two-component sensor histidine kinase